jgi:signal transduction histidine kinase/ActR/RegA family two-component response regulator
MRFGRLFALSMLSVTALVVVLGAEVLVPQYRTVAGKSEAIKAVEAFGAVLRVSEQIAGHRVGYVFALSQDGAATPAQLDLIAKRVQTSDAAFANARAALRALGDGAGILEGLDRAAARLSDVRAATDRALAVPKSARDAAAVDGFLSGVAQAVAIVEPLLNRLENQVATADASLTALLNIARNAQDLRIAAGGRAAVLSLAVTARRPATAAELSSMERGQGRVDRDRERIEANLDQIGSPVRVAKAFKDAVDIYFGRTVPWLEKEMPAARGDGQFGIDTGQLSNAIVPAVQSFLAVRDAALTEAAERAGIARDAALMALALTGVAVLALLGVLAGVTVILRLRLIKPLTALTDVISDLAAGRHDVMIPATERGDEIGTMAGSLQVFKEALIAKKAADEVAAASARAKSDFLAIMSHEIRTPMAGMMGMIHLLSETKLDQEQQKLADVAQISAQNLLSVVNDILDFSKLKAGQVKLEAIDFDLEDSINSVVALLGPKARDQGLALNMSLAEGLPRFLKGDPSRLAQVLLNLVGNALKFTEAGSVTIAASHRVLQDEAIELRIEVVDTGVGIPLEAQKSLFNPFTQADTSVSRKYGGTGLGLAICKRLCETMGGTIDIESEPGHGSKFWFTMRCAVGSEPEVAAPPLAPTTTTDAEAIDILVAEDNDIMRTLISKLLARRGYQADLVCDGKQAVEAVQTKHYDLVLMDMQMPQMDGITAARLIRGLSGPQREVPIIALTANALAGQREVCVAAGMNGFLTKPIQPDALYETIHQWGASRTHPTRGKSELAVDPQRC